MIAKVIEMVEDIYAVKPSYVFKYIIPCAMRNLSDVGGMKNEMKSVTTDLIEKLRDLLGTRKVIELGEQLVDGSHENDRLRAILNL
jgi:hypothetical protein